MVSLIAFGMCLYSGYQEHALGASFSFLLSLAFLIFANIDKIKKARASKDGFEVEMKEIIRKAEVTFSDLNELAKLAAQTSLSLVKRGARIGGFPISEQEAIKERVMAIVDQLSVTDVEQEVMLEDWHKFTEIDYVLLILGSHIPAKWPQEDQNKLSSIRHNLLKMRPSPTELRELLSKNNVLSKLHEEGIKDFEYYLENKRHRRLEFWIDQKDVSKQFNL